MAYDQEVIDAIFARAEQVADPGKRNRYLRAALQTGIVESGLRNLDYGDADSLGWRQERQQFYKDPMNITASVDRFFAEAAQHDRGQASWELAADVQRPAVAYRGRYKDVAKEAASLLGRGSNAGASSPAGSGTPSSAADVLGSKAPAAQLPGASDFTSLLSSLVSRPGPQAAPAMTIPAPQFSARVALPEGFMPLTPDSQPETPAERPVSQALSLLEGLRGADPALGSPDGIGGSEAPQMPSVADAVTQQRQSTVQNAGPKTKRGKVAVAGGANRQGVGLSKQILNFTERVAGIYGKPLTITTGTNHSQYTVNGNVSNHWDGNGADIAMDGDALTAAGQAALIAAGMSKSEARKQKGGLFNVGRYQIIFNTDEGGNHYDHLHVGYRG